MTATEDQTKYWDDLEAMFATDGWRQLVAEIKAEIYQHQADSLEATSWEQVCVFKGRAAALAYIANLQDVVRLQRAQKEIELIQDVEDADVSL